MPAPPGTNEIAPKSVAKNPNAEVNEKLTLKPKAWKHRKMPIASKNHASILTSHPYKITFFEDSKYKLLLNSEELSLKNFRNLTFLDSC
jgi:hypothetical protein